MLFPEKPNNEIRNKHSVKYRSNLNLVDLKATESTAWILHYIGMWRFDTHMPTFLRIVSLAFPLLSFLYTLLFLRHLRDQYDTSIWTYVLHIGI